MIVVGLGVVEADDTNELRAFAAGDPVLTSNTADVEVGRMLAGFVRLADHGPTLGRTERGAATDAQPNAAPLCARPCRFGRDPGNKPRACSSTDSRAAADLCRGLRRRRLCVLARPPTFVRAMPELWDRRNRRRHHQPTPAEPRVDEALRHDVSRVGQRRTHHRRRCAPRPRPC